MREKSTTNQGFLTRLVFQVVHPPGESDTVNAEFHAIHTPASNDGGEESDDDTGGRSEPEEEEVVGTFDPPPEDIVPNGVDVARAAMALRSLDQITLDTEFRDRDCLMRVVPKIIRGVERTAFRLSFQEAAEACATGNVEQETSVEVIHVRATNVADETPSRWCHAQSKTFRALRFARGEWLLLVEANRADESCSTTNSR